MRYIKTFPNHAAYMEFFDTDFEKPNVSYCVAEGEVHYNRLRTYSFVDMGLPSGTLWATDDITNEKDDTLYFAWGETKGYTKDEYLNGKTDKTFDLDGYELYDTVTYDDGETKSMQTVSGFTKYHTVPYPSLMWVGDGTVIQDPDSGMWHLTDPDGKRMLEPEDDAATVMRGKEWSIPTLGDYQELGYYTTAEFTYNEDWETEKVVLTSTVNGNKLTFNACGNLYQNIYGNNTPVYDPYNIARWCSTMDPIPFSEQNANCGTGWFGGSSRGEYSCERQLGIPIRPVKTENHEKHAHIDLNLPSGTLWANDFIRDVSGNILYFAWGETTGYSKEQIENGEREFTEEDYVLTKYDASDGKLQLDIEDDAARAYWGEGWQMPTSDQLYELFRMLDVLERWYHWDEEPRERLAYLMDGNSDNLQLGTTGYVEDASYIDGVETDIYCWSTDIGMTVKSLPYPGEESWSVAQAYQVHFADGDSQAYNQQYSRHMGLPILPVRSYTAARYDFVDLGLPSGTLWAAEDMKDSSGNPLRFAWADCVGHDSSYEFTQDNYRYGAWEEESGPKGGETKGGTRNMIYVMTKYNEEDDIHVIDPDSWNDDGTTDDMAYAWYQNTGGLYWRVPTRDQWDELLQYTTCELDASNGLFILTSTENGKQLTLTADPEENTEGSYLSVYWSSVLGNNENTAAFAAELWYGGNDGWDPLVTDYDRWSGYYVRPARYVEQQTVAKSGETGSGDSRKSFSIPVSRPAGQTHKNDISELVKDTSSNSGEKTEK